MKRIVLFLTLVISISCENEKKNEFTENSLEQTVKYDTIKTFSEQSLATWGKTRVSIEKLEPKDTVINFYNIKRLTKTESSFLSTNLIPVNYASQYRVSVIVRKGNSSSLFGLRIVGKYPDRVDAIFNIVEGKLIAVKSSGDFYRPFAKIEDLGNGLYKCVISSEIAADNIRILMGPTRTGSNVLSWEGKVNDFSDIDFSPSSLTIEEKSIIINKTYKEPIVRNLQRYSGIEKTLNLLNESSEVKENELKILFYGQSIIGGLKSEILLDSLRRKFPHTRIISKNKAIGGFTVPYLIKTADHDLFNENPDLIIFHAYDGIKDGLYDSLIRKIRERLNSDILLLNHHYVWDKPEGKLDKINRSHDYDSDQINAIAKKYGCGIVDVRTKWKNYLDNKNLTPNVLMGNGVDPNVHPNTEGNKLLRSIVLESFIKRDSDYNITNDKLIHSLSVKEDINSTINLTANRAVLKTKKQYNKNAKVIVFVNDKRPSEIPSNYTITRPSEGYKSWMPAITKVSFGKEFPREEQWHVEIYAIDYNNKSYKFKLYGSKTGYDGEGNSDSDFLSISKRIKIDKEDFIIFKIEEITGARLENAYKVNFDVKLLVKDTLLLERKTAEYLLFRGLKKEEIKLKLNVISGNPKFTTVTGFFIIYKLIDLKTPLLKYAF